MFAQRQWWSQEDIHLVRMFPGRRLISMAGAGTRRLVGGAEADDAASASPAESAALHAIGAPRDCSWGLGMPAVVNPYGDVSRQRPRMVTLSHGPNRERRLAGGGLRGQRQVPRAQWRRPLRLQRVRVSARTTTYCTMRQNFVQSINFFRCSHCSLARYCERAGVVDPH